AITATALARLVDAERIALDSGIARHLSPLPNADWAVLTPRQLASHTAGIVDYATNRDLPGLWRSVRETRRYESATAALDIFDGSGLRSRPGTRFLYSSFDVNLLGAVMEAVTGTAYPQLMDALVFRPLAVRSIHAQGVTDSSAHAVFYDLRDGRWRPWRRVDHTYKWPSGGLVATPSDVARIGGAWFDTTFIRAATRATFWTPQRLADGRINEQSYALGWRVSRQPRLVIDGCPVLQVHHGGVSKGSFSWFVLYPQRRIAVSLMMNGRAHTFGAFAGEELAITRLVLRATTIGGGDDGRR
ncbi:MAG: beta-lactamase family protein, partial [Gemmatimonadaceae bacterium]|nr:beta-lactamase family protein [Gemmatimonadaceae bacterium]